MCGFNHVSAMLRKTSCTQVCGPFILLACYYKELCALMLTSRGALLLAYSGGSHLGSQVVPAPGRWPPDTHTGRVGQSWDMLFVLHTLFGPVVLSCCKLSQMQLRASCYAFFAFAVCTLRWPSCFLLLFMLLTSEPMAISHRGLGLKYSLFVSITDVCSVAAQKSNLNILHVLCF